MFVMDTHKHEASPVLTRSSVPLLVTWAVSSVSHGHSRSRDGPEGPLGWLSSAPPPPPPGPLTMHRALALDHSV